jgi:hypothetical protein
MLYLCATARNHETAYLWLREESDAGATAMEEK